MPNEETRQRLIAEARKAFIAKGYEATKLDRIATAAGISKKTIYRYAASKTELFAAVVMDAMRPIPFGDLLAATDDAHPEAALRSFLQAVADLALSQDGLDFYRMIMREAANFPDMLPRFYAVLADFFAGLVHWMEHQKARGWLAIEAPEEAAGTILSLLLADVRSNYLLGIRFAPDAEEREQLVDRALKLFLHGSLAPAHRDPG